MFSPPNTRAQFGDPLEQTLRMTVIDAFLANDELEMIELRVTYLESDVEAFYVGESRWTFSGIQKPLFVRDWLRKNPLNPKVMSLEIPIPDSLLASGNRWAIEFFSRRWLAEEVSRRHPHSAIMLSDVDEFPSRSQSQALSGALRKNRVVRLPMKNVMRFGNWVTSPPRKLLKSAIAFNAESVPRKLRKCGLCPSVAGESGVHLSYVGMDRKQIAGKYASFSHAELDGENATSEWVLNLSREYRVNHCGASDRRGMGLLVQESFDQLNDVQSYIYSRKPSWFSLEKESHPLLERIAASVDITQRVRQGNQVGELGSLPVRAAHKPKIEASSLAKFLLIRFTGVPFFTRNIDHLRKRFTKKMPEII